MLSHEIRGALTIISGFGDLLRTERSAAAKTTALEGIARAVDRIDRLVQSALDGSLGEAETGQRLRIRDLVERVAAEQRAVTGRSIDVVVQEDPWVLGSSDALERALGNVVTNALKYSLRGSHVEVFVGVAGEWATVTVADRGPGVPEGERERVFEPFERLDAHEALPGSGLGLTVVRGVAEAHGGSVGIEDRVGGGSLVRISLPLAPV